jgi:hypothetical protein
VSKSVNITSLSGASLILEALNDLAEFSNASWPNLSINITSSNDTATIGDAYTSTAKICETDIESIHTIRLYSEYGPIDGLGLIDSTYNSSVASSLSSGANLTFTSNVASGSVYECSNQGHCDRLVLALYSFFI